MVSRPAQLQAKAIAIAPLLVLPAVAIAAGHPLRPWLFMWLMALSLFAGCKWLTYRMADRAADPVGASWARRMGYLFAWPGLDANAFLDPARRGVAAARREWISALGLMVLGVGLLAGAAITAALHPLVRGWMGMIGSILLLHFGGFMLLSCLWRSIGVEARPLMQRPTRSRTVGEFWGLRWNTAFRDLTHRFLFRPLIARIGVRAAIVAGFLISGLVHELVITVPARGGYGLPTTYFVAQGLAMLLERTRAMRAMRGRCWTAIVVAAPAPLLLFPPVFVERVIVPMLQDLGTLLAGN